MFLTKADLETPMLDAARKKKYSLPLIFELVVFVLVFCVSQVLSVIIDDFILSPLLGVNSSPLSPLDLYTTAITIAVVISYCLLFEGRSLLSLGFVKRRAVLDYIIGFGIGLFMFTAVMLVCLPFGAIKLEPTPRLPTVIPTLTMFLGGFIVQGFAEEMLCRSYLLNSLYPRAGAPCAVGLSAVVFSLLHIGNAGITLIAFINVALFGIFAGIYFLRRQSIWGIAALHSAWNFAEGNIFGVPVSGVLPKASVFVATADESTYWLSGGDFGAEGGLAVTVVLALAMIAAYFLPHRNNKKPSA